MTTKRKIYKIRLTLREAVLVLEAVEDVHSVNTNELRGTNGEWKITHPDVRALILEENTALRQVRNALKRALPPDVASAGDPDTSLLSLLKEAREAVTQE